jgi:uncharacterized membrane protein YdjX (TVP38/TMEM64 family)
MSAIVNWLGASQHYFQDLGWLGVLAFAGVAVIMQLFLAPLSPAAIAAGLFFGFTRGMIAMELGTGIGLVLNFMIARYVAREAISKRLQRHEKFRLIDAAIGREGGKIVLLLRCCPIPFGLSNFCYGLTAVRFWPYFFASVIGIIPGTAFFTWLGATTQSLQSALDPHRQRHLFDYLLPCVGVIAAFLALTYITKIARAAVANQTGVAVPAGPEA